MIQKARGILVLAMTRFREEGGRGHGRGALDSDGVMDVRKGGLIQDRGRMACHFLPVILRHFFGSVE